MLVNFSGAQVGGYTLLAEIGRGGMGRVYRASYPGTTQLFAIKVVNALTTRDEKFERRFWREVAVVNRLNHPAILPVLASGQEDDGMLFMVMPLVEGGTLKDYLQCRPALVLDEVCRIASQLGSALDYAHSQGVFHRDVKPHNIMMMGEGKVCLTDFGVAALASVDETVTNLTSTGATLGTFAYMSPEQISGVELDGRADVYSLGVVVYQMLVGRLPFGGDNTATLLSQQLHSQPVSPHLINPDFPLEIEAVLDKVLAKQAGDRYQSGAEFAAALDAAREALPEDMAATPLVTPEQIAEASSLANVILAAPAAKVQPPPRQIARRLVLIGLALVALAVVLCSVVVLPLQAQLAEVQGTAAALGSRTPVIVTQMVTNAAGESVIIQITTTPLPVTPTQTPTSTSVPVLATQPTIPVTNSPQPSLAPTLEPDAGTGGGSTGQSSTAVSPTKAPKTTGNDTSADHSSNDKTKDKTKP